MDASVVVPFDVFDVCRVDDSGDSIDDVVLDFSLTDIQDQLVPGECPYVISCMHAPKSDG